MKSLPVAFLILSTLFIEVGFANGNWPQLSPEEWSSMDADALQSYLEENGVDDRTPLLDEAWRFVPTGGTRDRPYTPLLAPDPEVSFTLPTAIVTVPVDLSDRPFGWTPLFWAARYSTNPEAIRLLIEQGANLEVRDTKGMTPIMVAILKNRNLEVSLALIEAGADTNVSDVQGLTPLGIATRFQPDTRLLSALIERLPESSRDRPGVMDAFLFFLHAGGAPSESYRPILEAGANPFASYRSGPLAINPFIEFVEDEEIEMIELFLEYGNPIGLGISMGATGPGLGGQRNAAALQATNPLVALADSANRELIRRFWDMAIQSEERLRGNLGRLIDAFWRVFRENSTHVGSDLYWEVHQATFDY